MKKKKIRSTKETKKKTKKNHTHTIFTIKQFINYTLFRYDMLVLDQNQAHRALE